MHIRTHAYIHAHPHTQNTHLHTHTHSLTHTHTHAHIHTHTHTDTHTQEMLFRRSISASGERQLIFLTNCDMNTLETTQKKRINRRVQLRHRRQNRQVGAVQRGAEEHRRAGAHTHTHTYTHTHKHTHTYTHTHTHTHTYTHTQVRARNFLVFQGDVEAIAQKTPVMPQ
jgi:hypothetical protein